MLVALLLSGCGKSDGESTRGQLEGRELSRTSQLVGSWMRISPGPFLGLEFRRDDTAIVTHWVHRLEGEAITLNYSVLDGGRLSLVAPTGFTEVFSVVFAGDELEISRERANSEQTTRQRFRRLGGDQTLAAGLREHQAAIERQRAERAETLQRFLTAEDLVLRAAESGPTGAVLSLQHQPSNPLEGTAVADPNPARHDPLQPIRVGQWRAELVPADELSSELNLRLTFVPQGSAGSGSNPITLAVSGGGQPTIRGSGALPPLWSGSTELVLVRDSGAHRRSLARLEEQRESVRQALAAVSDPLGGRAILRGTRSSLGSAEPVEVMVQLERRGTEAAFIGTSEQRGQSFTVTAQADVLLGAGALYVNLANGEQWRLQRKQDGKYVGPWRPNSRSDFASHGEVSLDLGRVWTVAQVTAEREAMDRYATEGLRQPTALVGFVAKGAADDRESWPVWLELQASDDGSVRGQAWLLGQNVGVALEGRRSNRSFNLQARSALPGSENDRALASQRWQFDLVSMDPDPRFEGRLSSNLGKGGPVVFAPLTDATKSAMRSALRDALRTEAWRVVNLVISRRQDPSHFVFESSSGDTIRGSVFGADLSGRSPSGLPPGLIDGEWAEVHQLPVLRLRVAGSPDPVRGREGLQWDLTIAANALDGAPTLTGWNAPGPGNQVWLRITPEADKASVQVAPDQQLRVAAHRLGAALAPPKSPAVGDEVLLLIHATDRDVRLGQIHYADGRYAHGNSIPRAALHAGLIKPGETAVVRLRFHPPHTAPTVAAEQHGVTSTAGTFRPNNINPTFRLERVDP